MSYLTLQTQSEVPGSWYIFCDKLISSAVNILKNFLRLLVHKNCLIELSDTYHPLLFMLKQDV